MISQEISKIIIERFDAHGGMPVTTHLHERFLLYSLQMQGHLVVSHSDSLGSFLFNQNIPKFVLFE